MMSRRPPYCADRQTAADHFPQRRQIGANAEQCLSAAGVHAKPRHHFIENEQRAVISRDLAERGEKALGRWNAAHIAGDRLDDDGRDLLRELPKSRCTESKSLKGAISVSATAAGGTPGESGNPSVATPEPACTSSTSAWP